jgi:HSP20 family protein
MQREINKMFDHFFRTDAEEEESFAASRWLPAVDIAEKEDRFLVTMELPGVAREDVKITLQDRILTIRGEKKQENVPTSANVHRVERLYGGFQRSFTLPATVQGDAIDASYRDGVLTIAIPKAEEARPKQIDVKVR